MSGVRVHAQGAVAKAVRGGALIRQSCSICGAEPAEAHHEDYGKPLEVIWLCRRHHARRHHERGDYKSWAATKASRSEAGKRAMAEHFRKMEEQRSKLRSFTFILPIDLVAKIGAIAEEEDRSQDSIIEAILNDCAEAWQAKARAEAAAEIEAAAKRTTDPTSRDIERLAFEGRVSMAELCRLADVHPSTFRYWKSGRSSPSVAIVQALLDVGLAAVKAAKLDEQGIKTPARRRRTPVVAKTRAKAAAAKRQARRSA